MDDVTDGLPYPDGYFDAIHLRGLAAGVSIVLFSAKLRNSR